jgi:hypothetical protein
MRAYPIIVCLRAATIALSADRTMAFCDDLDATAEAGVGVTTY